MVEKMVRCGAPSTCSTCGLAVDAHEVALRRSDRAVTFRERCHMDGRGMVHWYHHPKCREINARTKEPK